MASRGFRATTRLLLLLLGLFSKHTLHVAIVYMMSDEYASCMSTVKQLCVVRTVNSNQHCVDPGDCAWNARAIRWSTCTDTEYQRQLIAGYVRRLAVELQHRPHEEEE